MGSNMCNIYKILCFTILLLIGIEICDIYAQTIRQTPNFEEQQYAREKLNKVLNYLKFASIELEGTNYNQDVKDQINALIKYLSVKNLQGDYFTQYAKENADRFLADIKHDYLEKITNVPNKRVIMEKRIEDRLRNPYSDDEINYRRKVMNNRVNIDKDDNDLRKPNVKYFGGSK